MQYYSYMPKTVHTKTTTVKDPQPAPQLAVFDIDGTITAPHSNSIDKQVLDGILHLRSQGVVTTVCTGRPFARMKDALGDYYDTVISDEALIAVEHGAKVVDKKGNVVVETEFNTKDLDHFIAFTAANLDMVRFLSFHPGDLSRKSQIWCSEPTELDAIIKERGYYSDVFSGSFVDLRTRLDVQTISCITIKLKKHIKVENLKLEFTRSATKILLQDGNMEFIKSRVNKARAITFIRKQLGFYEHNVLVAGNAINDVDMLNMEAGHRILVGEEGQQRDIILGYLYGHEYVTFVNTPTDLGLLLQKL